MLYHTMNISYYSILYHTTWYIILYHTISYDIMLCHAISYYSILYHTIPCYIKYCIIILYHNISYLYHTISYYVYWYQVSYNKKTKTINKCVLIMVQACSTRQRRLRASYRYLHLESDREKQRCTPFYRSMRQKYGYVGLATRWYHCVSAHDTDIATTHILS